MAMGSDGSNRHLSDFEFSIRHQHFVSDLGGF